MAGINPEDPQSANQYDDRTTAAVKSVLVEIGQILGSFQGKYAVIGGAVPWLLLDNLEMPHVGTIDVDLSVDAEALGDGEYVRLVETLMTNGYEQNKQLKKFQLVRNIAVAGGGSPVDIIVAFLMPRDAQIDRNKPPILDDFAVQRADGADLAIHFNQLVAVRGSMPKGGINTVEIAVCSIPALLAMKGHAIQRRYKQRTRTTFTIVFAIIQTESAPLPQTAKLYSQAPAGQKDTDLSTRSSMKSRGSVRPA